MHIQLTKSLQSLHDFSVWFHANSQGSFKVLWNCSFQHNCRFVHGNGNYFFILLGKLTSQKLRIYQQNNYFSHFLFEIFQEFLSDHRMCNWRHWVLLGVYKDQLKISVISSTFNQTIFWFWTPESIFQGRALLWSLSCSITCIHLYYVS